MGTMNIFSYTPYPLPNSCIFFVILFYFPAKERFNKKKHNYKVQSAISPSDNKPPPTMDFWNRARTFAEEAATKTLEAAKRSQDLTIGSSKLSDLVSEAAKRSKELAAEASRKSMEIAAEASKRAESIKAEAVSQIKSQMPSAAAAVDEEAVDEEEMERFGVTDDLRDFVKGITVNTFRDFPLQDDSEVSDIPTVSNVRQDLTAWQEKHAKIVLSTVKEISKLRYELCPRAMKERKFWRIYFILVNSHVSHYEKRYTEEAILKSAEEVKEDKIKESSTSGTLSKSEAETVNQKKKNSSANEQDLDVFLLGDLGDSDEGPDDGDRDFDDDFDKL